MRGRMRIGRDFLWVAGVGCVAFFLVVWACATFPSRGEELYLLNVGQGDAHLLRVGGITVLIDAGKDAQVVDELDKLSFPGKYIDLVFISHPEVDHLGGLFSLIRRYSVGAVIFNGQSTTLWEEATKVLSQKQVPFLSLFQGDRVMVAGGEFRVLWPSATTSFQETNDRSSVLKFEGGEFRILFSGDISSLVEKELLGFDLQAEVLKVPHHGSKFSSSWDFLSSVSPLVSLVGVGKNSYGHPTPEVLGRLSRVGAEIFRSDQQGTVKILSDGGVLRVYPVP